MKLTSFFRYTVGAAGAVFATTVMHAATAPAPAAVAAVDYAGDQQPLQAVEETIRQAGPDAAKLSNVVSELLAVLQQPQATLAAKQAACERLGRLLQSPPQISQALTILGPWLVDERQGDLARLALERVPGDAIDAALVRAVGQSTGRARIGVIQSLGVRRTTAGIEPLGRLLADSDKATAEAAANALGKIGTAAALAALSHAPDAQAPAIQAARLSAAWTVPPAEGAAVLKDLHASAGTTPANKLAAFRGLLTLEPDAAPQRMLTALASDDTRLKRVVIEAIATPAATAVIPQLCQQLASWDAPTQAAVIAALGRRGTVEAVPVLTKALDHADAAVRAAAIDALGRLPGNREVAQKLATLATDAVSDEGKLARASLARLTGPGVADTVLEGARNAEPALRSVYLEVIALRGMADSVPVLLAAREAAEPAVRGAALTALGVIAPASVQPALLTWTLQAQDPTELTRAQRALVNVTLRNSDETARTQPLIAALDQAAPAVQVRLIPVLARVGGKSASEAAVRIATGADRAAATAAVTALSRWPDDSVLPQLVTVMEKSTLPEVQAQAAQAALRMLDQSRTSPATEPAALIVRLCKASPTPAVRKQALRRLGRTANPEALAYAQSLTSDAECGAEARDAAAAIEANRSWPPAVTASTGHATSIFDGKPRTEWRVPATAGQWLQVDFKRSRPVHVVTLDQGTRNADYPEAVDVFVTDDPKAPGEPRAHAAGQRDRTRIELPAGVTGRYLIIKSTAARADANWTVAECQID